MTDVTDRRPPPPVAVVVTSPRESGNCSPCKQPIDLVTPAWARDEPPSPTAQIGSTSDSRIISDTSSLRSTSGSASRWWSFNLRTRQESFGLLPHSIKPDKKSVRDNSLTWMPSSSSVPHDEGYTFIRKDKEKEPNAYPHLRVSVPRSAQLPNTVTTSGSDIPWASPSQPDTHDPLPQLRRGSPYRSEQVVTTKLLKWNTGKQQIRSFIFANVYAPLVRLLIISLLQNLN